MEGHSPWARDERNAVPILVEDVEAVREWEQHRETFRAEGIRALAFLPLLHRHELLGKFMVYEAQPRRFTPNDLQLTQTIGALVSQAVVRARLFEHEQTRAVECARLYEAEARRKFERVGRHAFAPPVG
jgi:GAF domain-containing protein